LKPLLYSTLIALVAAAGFIACRQGKGDRCQTDDDCTTPLVCNKGSQVCSSTTGGGIDALPLDAGPPDAPPDAAADAM
jgi:hypothetical protein